MESPKRKADALKERLVGGTYSQLASYADLFHRTSEGIFLLEIDTFEVLESNPAAARLLGSAEGSSNAEAPWVGKQFDSLFGEAGREPLRALLSETRSSQQPTLRGELEWSGLALELTAARLKLADYCEVFQVIVKDVTAARAAQRKLESLSLTDELTGIANVRSFRSRLDLVHARAGSAKNGHYSVIFCDVDHFKHFNDRNGHPAGDEALRRVAAILKQLSDRDHFVARYGGEEFVVLCQGETADEAAEFAERVREAVVAAKVPHSEHQPLGHLSLSLGVAESRADGTASEDVLRRADTALYRSKQLGRNRVTVEAGRKGGAKAA